VFGRFLASSDGLLGGKGAELAGWRSSSSGRVLRSGAAIVSQMATSTQAQVDPGYDDRFQLWGQHFEFKQWVQATVRRGEGMQHLAQRHAELLQVIWAQATDGAVHVTLPAAGPAAAAAPAGHQGSHVWTALEAAWHTTYLHELLRCETHHASNKRLLLRGQLHAGCGGSWGRHWHPPLSPPLCALLQRLSPGQQAFVQRCACYVWEQRFLANKRGAALGMPLLKQAAEDLLAAQGSKRKTWLYSGHDYTILVLLAALRQRKYPPRALDFGAFVQLQLVRFEGRDSLRGGLCPAPFPFAAEGSALTLSAHCPESLFEDLPLEGFTHMLSTAACATWPTSSHAATGAGEAGMSGNSDTAADDQ